MSSKKRTATTAPSSQGAAKKARVTEEQGRTLDLVPSTQVREVLTRSHVAWSQPNATFDFIGYGVEGSGPSVMRLLLTSTPEAAYLVNILIALGERENPTPDQVWAYRRLFEELKEKKRSPDLDEGSYYNALVKRFHFPAKLGEWSEDTSEGKTLGIANVTSVGYYMYYNGDF